MCRILFVCTGNTCRSPMAASAMADCLARRGENGRFVCCSAGLFAREGEPVSPHAVEALKEAGIPLLEGQAHVLTPQAFLEADWVFALTQGHYQVLVRRWPQNREKVRLLSPGGIADPYGGTLQDYRDCLKQIMLAVENWSLGLQK